LEKKMPLLRKVTPSEFGLIPLQGMAQKHAFLCCPGPSLANVDTTLLHAPGAMVLAINTAYPKVKPDLWIGMDSPPSYDPNLWWEPFPKICGDRYLHSMVNGAPLADVPNVHFIQGQGDVKPWQMPHMLGLNDRILWAQPYPSTFMVALHALMMAGAKAIYLVGCDFGGTSDYHDGRVLSDDKRTRNRILMKAIVYDMFGVATEAKAIGIDIISCTADSPVNTFIPYMTIDQARENIAKSIPQPVFDKVLDGGEAESCEWLIDAPKAPRGVVTASDKNQEWLLPWWYANLRRHNPDIPVCFVDYGLTDEGRKWCMEHGSMLQLGGQMPQGLVWFRKPLCLLKSPFETTVWIDLDCEIRGNITPWLDSAANGLVLTEDQHNPWCKQYREVPLQSGVVGVKKGNPLVSKWMEAIFQRPGEFRGDQEALNYIVAKMDAKIVILPAEYQWLRLAGDPPANAVVVHWTGVEGKAIIKAQIAANAAKPAVPAERPLVSILMSAYNADRWIGEAIESCRKQTYQNWELIVVDDGSKTPVVYSGDSRVTVHRTDNRGQYAALNLAWSLAKGQYVARLDADDMQDSTRLAKQVAYLEAHRDTDIVTTGARLTDEAGSDKGLHQYFGAMDTASYLAGSLKHPVNASQMARHSVWETVMPLDPKYTHMGDCEWNIKAIVAGCRSWGHIAEPLYVYRRHAGSQSLCGANKCLEQHAELLKRYTAKSKLSILTCISGRPELYRNHLTALAACSGEADIEYCVGLFGDITTQPHYLREFEAKFEGGVKVARIESTDSLAQLHAQNAALQLVTNDRVLVIGSEIKVAPGVLADAARVPEKTAVFYGVHNSADGRSYIGTKRKIALSFAMAIHRQDLVAIGGWDLAYAHGTCFDDNDLSARLLVSGVTFRWNFGLECVHQSHPPASSGSTRQEEWARNNGIWQSRLNGYRGPLWPLCSDNSQLIHAPEIGDGIEQQAALRAALIERGYRAKW
jgi:glycosyltransferase involved in cell wall biosynthesis